jgi:CrcB protein
MELEIVKMIEAGHYALAMGYGCASVGAGFVAIWLGHAIVRRPRLL